MPTVSLLRIPAVTARVGLSRRTIYYYVDAGKFPKPIKIGVHAIAWPSNVIDAWIAAKVAKAERARTH